LLNFADLDTPLNELCGAPHWYVGFSGGVDSTVLLHLLHSWCGAHPESPALSAIHVNHGMQSTADAWQRHCEAVCRSLNLALDSHSVSVDPQSGEAAARDARYRVFAGQLQPGAVLFLGHHMDDQVETFFLRLLRGAGVEGLAAIPRQRDLEEGQLVRPLLDFSRETLENYAAHHALETVEDPSNKDTAMDRNFLRQQLLPLMASRWPAYRQSVARASGHMAAAARILGEVPETVHSAMGDAGLLLAALVAEPDEVAANRLRAWLRAHGCLAPDQSALNEFLRQLREMDDDSKPRLECGSYTLQRYREGVYRLPDITAPVPARSIELVPVAGCKVPGVGIVSLQRTECDGFSLVPGEQLSLGWRQGGERCRLPGRSGSRSLKTLLQELQIPPWWRDRVPLIFLDEELLAVADLASCESTRWRGTPQEGEILWRVSWERPELASSD
jgi:tRNA(Ile)-lysidine synthase